MDDLISRQAAIDALHMHLMYRMGTDSNKKRLDDWINSLPSAQETHEERMETHACDLIDREAAVDAIYHHLPSVSRTRARTMLHEVPSAQPEVIRCKDCIYYDPPHVENNGVRYEYDEMPADAFDALGTGLVSVEYGTNIGGRCCVDYYCKNYSDDKRVFVREDNYCGRAERRTNETD